MLIRATVALIFGAVTIFWASPSVQVLAWAVGLYLLGTAAALWLSRALPIAVPVVVAAGGAGALATQSDAGVALSAMLALLVLGLLELVHGLRKRDAVARDWLFPELFPLAPLYCCRSSPRWGPMRCLVWPAAAPSFRECCGCSPG